jgi:hypothetical protein
MKIASRDPILEEIEPESIYRLKIKQYRKRVSYKPLFHKHLPNALLIFV